jgi:GGDEF domain-containing protein
VISILKSVSTLENLEELKRAALECYGHALAATEQNTIEITEGEADKLRADLRTLLERWERAQTPEQLRHIQELFGGELRDYREAAQEDLRRLRRNMDAAARALEEFAGKTITNGDDHEKELTHGLRKLDLALSIDNTEEIRSAVRSATSTIRASFEQMRALNRIAIAQLKDEIRILHERGPRSRTPAPKEQTPAAETHSRSAVDNQIDTLLTKTDASFCLVVVALRNFKALSARHSGTVMADALQSLQVRLRDMVGSAATVGRWKTGQIVVILSAAPANAMVLSRDISQRLAQPYDFSENGVRQSLTFQVGAGVLDHRSGADAAKFRAGLEKLSSALGGAS